MVKEKLDPKIANGCTKDWGTSFLSIWQPAELAVSSDPLFHTPGLSPNSLCASISSCSSYRVTDCCSIWSHESFPHSTQG